MNNLIIIDECINNIINKHPNLEDGVAILQHDVLKSFDNHQLEWLNSDIIMESYKEFEKWLNHIFMTEPLPEDVIAFNFGIFLSEDGIQPYISGSSNWSKDNFNWIHRKDYLPEGRYPYITVFEHITNTFKESKWLAIYLAIGVCIIFIKAYAINNAKELLTDNIDTIYFSTGFNEENNYNIGKLTNSGFEAI